MPIAKEVRSRDFPTTHSYLKVTLCNIHDELTRRADLPALARQLGDAKAGAPVANVTESAFRLMRIRARDLYHLPGGGTHSHPPSSRRRSLA